MLPFSKLWLFLITLVGGVLIIGLLAAPQQLQRAHEESATARLELAQQSATLLLQNSARKWVDTAVHFASDAPLVSALEEAGRGEAEAALLQRSLHERLSKAQRSLGVSFLAVVDVKGRVVSQIGLGGAKGEDEAGGQDWLSGVPAVADAVRGYRLDDLWLKEGKLYRIAAVPFIATARDRYLGALLLGQELTNELAGQLHSALGVDVAFWCAGRVVASSRGTPEEPLRQFLESTAREGARRSSVKTPTQELLSWVELPGDGAAPGAALVLLSPAPQQVSLRAALPLLLRALAEMGLPAQLIAPLGIGVTLCFLIGLLALYLEAERPLRRLKAALREQEARPAEPAVVRAPPAVTPPAPAPVAPSLSTPPPAAAPAGLASRGTAPRPTPPPALVMEPALFQTQPLMSGALASVSYAAAARPEDTTYEDLPPEEEEGEAGLPTLRGIGLPRGRSGASPRGPVVSGERTTPGIGGAALAAVDIPDPKVTGALIARAAPASARTLHDPGLAATMRREAGEEEHPEHVTVRELPSSVVQAAIETALQSSPASYHGPVPPALLALQNRERERRAGRDPDIHDETTAVGSEGRVSEQRVQPPAPRSPEADPETDIEAELRRTFQAFVTTKRQCNEPLEGITYERFSVKLRQSREQIIKQHRCRTVRFHVYIKDGKAALKATPIMR